MNITDIKFRSLFLKVSKLKKKLEKFEKDLDKSVRLATQEEDRHLIGIDQNEESLISSHPD